MFNACLHRSTFKTQYDMSCGFDFAISSEIRIKMMVMEIMYF